MDGGVGASVMMASSLLVTVDSLDSLDGLDGLDGLDDGFEVGFAGPPRRGFLEALPDVVAFMVRDGWSFCMQHQR